MPGKTVVLLSTRFAVLEHRDTRWGAVLRDWAAKGRPVEVVDFPRFTARPVVPVRTLPSWLPQVTAWEVNFPLTRPARHAHDRLLARAVAARLASRLGIGRGDRLLATSPLWSELADVSGHRWGFDAVDDWNALPIGAVYRRRVEMGYGLVRRAASVTAVSSSLASALSAETGRPVQTVSNGVDVARMTQPGTPPARLPEEPFAVYIGHLGTLDRVSVEHLLAVTHAGVPVVSAGEATGDVARRLADAGVHHIGPVPRDELPGLLARAAVGLVPHRDTPLTRSMDAMKTLEYLAAGLPVVTTSVGARPEYADRMLVEDDPVAFAAAVLAAATWRRQLPSSPLRTWAVVADELWSAHSGEEA